MTKSRSRPPTRPVGAQSRIPPEVVRKLFEASGLSRADFAQLARASVRQVPNGGYSSSTVDSWLSKSKPSRMAADTYELLVLRLWLREHHYATFSELVNQPLKDIVAKLLE